MANSVTFKKRRHQSAMEMLADQKGCPTPEEIAQLDDEALMEWLEIAMKDGDFESAALFGEEAQKRKIVASRKTADNFDTSTQDFDDTDGADGSPDTEYIDDWQAEELGAVSGEPFAIDEGEAVENLESEDLDEELPDPDWKESNVKKFAWDEKTSNWRTNDVPGLKWDVQEFDDGEYATINYPGSVVDYGDGEQTLDRFDRHDYFNGAGDMESNQFDSIEEARDYVPERRRSSVKRSSDTGTIPQWALDSGATPGTVWMMDEEPDEMYVVDPQLGLMPMSGRGQNVMWEDLEESTSYLETFNGEPGNLKRVSKRQFAAFKSRQSSVKKYNWED